MSTRETACFGRIERKEGVLFSSRSCAFSMKFRSDAGLLLSPHEYEKKQWENMGPL